MITGCLVIVAASIAVTAIAAVCLGAMCERRDAAMKRRLREKREMEARPHGWRY